MKLLIDELKDEIDALKELIDGEVLEGDEITAAYTKLAALTIELNKKQEEQQTAEAAGKAKYEAEAAEQAEEREEKIEDRNNGSTVSVGLEKSFKGLVGFQLALPVTMIILGNLRSDNGQTESNSDEIWTNEDFFVIAFFITFLVHLFSLFQLWKFKPLGKTLYLFFTPVMLVSSSFITSTESIVFDLLSEYVWAMAMGSTIAMLYLTDIKKKFQTS
jgi:hypothetical protein